MAETSAPDAPEDIRAGMLAEHYAHCEKVLRDGDRDAWIASLFAPADKRPHLTALGAFSLEIAHVRALVSDPAPGEIRLQWWVDAIEGEARGDVRSHPVADALIDTVRKFRLPRSALTDLIEARRFDLYDENMADLEALEAWCGHTSSVMIRLDSIVLADGADPGGADAAGFAGVAIGLTALLRSFAWHAGEGRLYVPVDVLARHGLTPAAALMRPAPRGLPEAIAEVRALARRRYVEAMAALDNVAPAARSAFLPLACVPLFLERLEKAGNPHTPPRDVPLWRRQWAIWRMAKKLGA